MAAGLSLTQAQLAPAMARLAELLARRAPATDPAAQPPPRRPRRPRRRHARARRPRSPPPAPTAPAPRRRGSRSPAPHRRGRRVGDGHLALRSRRPAGGQLDAVAFRAAETPLGAFLADRAGAPRHLAGRLERDDLAAAPGVKLTSRTPPRPADFARRQAGLNPRRGGDTQRPRRALRLSVRTPDFQSGKTGSTPVGRTTAL